MSSFLDLICESTKELESPERFFWWSGLSAISAIVRKNVWVNRFSYKLYLNVQTLLVSEKSGLRKGLPVSYAKEIVEALDCTRIISGGDNTVQGLIKELACQTTSKTGKVYSDAQAFLCAFEFSSFLRSEPGALTKIVDLYNVQESDNWTKRLSGQPIQELKNRCITILGATNESLFDEIIRDKDIEGGFVARTFIVHERARRTVNSLMYAPKNLISPAKLADEIKFLPSLQGEMQMPDIVRQEYDTWYRKMSASDYEDRTGTMERIGDHVLKVASLISLVENHDTIMDVNSLHMAIRKCEETLQGSRLISLSQGSSDIVIASAKVMKILIGSKDHQLRRRQILNKLAPDVNTLTFDRVVDDLLQRGIIHQPYLDPSAPKRGTEFLLYKLKDDVIKMYETVKKGALAP